MTFHRPVESIEKHCLLVLATTYPRWAGDHEPGFVHELCKRLGSDFRVVVVTPDSPDADPSGDLEGVEVVRYRYAPRTLQTLVNDGGIASNLRRSAWKWLLVPSFVLMQYVVARSVLRSRKVDVIHAHWLISPGLVASALSGDRIPFLVTSHGGDLFGFRGRLFSSVKRWVAAKAAAMTVVSDAMMAEVKRLHLPANHVETIPMGVDMQERFVLDPSVIRSDDELLFVGRLVPKKGLRYLLAAFPSILAVRPATRLRIVGFGPERVSLEATVAALGLTHCVTFSGAAEQKDLPSIYQGAAAFVAPFVRDDSGDQEGLPVALMEAISTGCPFIVGNVAGLDDLLGDMANESRVVPGDSQALARAILELLAEPARARKSALAVRERVASLVDWGTVSSRYARVIESCMTGRQ